MKINGGHHWLERVLRSALAFVSHSVFAEEIACRPGLLQSLDPRARAASLLSFVVALLFAQSLKVLCFLYLLSLVLAGLSRINLAFFLKRTWVFIPLFSLFIALPALFSFASPGPVVMRLGPLAVTSTGARAAAFFVLRVAASVSFMTLLSLTTRHFELLKVLRAFRAPSLFVMVLGMAWRYIGLFVETLENTFRAIKSRVGYVSRARTGRRLAAWNLASLWSRSFQLNEMVYDAMRSRGFQGEVVLLHEFRTRARDWAWIVITATIIVFLALLGRRGSL